jgi:2-polyprenyl-3-methyl-5-hydroxy-6-metoxy-1,4-benzoquinol methylase
VLQTKFYIYSTMPIIFLPQLQHIDAQVRFDQQVENSRDYVLPFIEKNKQAASGIRVLEVGCGEGGVLKPFIDKGIPITNYGMALAFLNGIFERAVFLL